MDEHEKWGTKMKELSKAHNKEAFYSGIVDKLVWLLQITEQGFLPGDLFDEESEQDSESTG